MTQLSLTYSLVRVGPRQAGAPIYFALQVAAGTSAEPTGAHLRRRWLRACLAQSIFRGLQSIPVQLRFGKHKNDLGTRTITAHRGDSGTPVAFLADAVRKKTDTLPINSLRLQWPLADGDDEKEQSEDRWIVQMQSLASLPPQLGGALSSSWYFKLPEDLLSVSPDGCYFAAAPLFIFDAIAGVRLDLATFSEGLFSYAGPDGLTASAQGEIHQLQVTAPAPLDRHWLQVRDAREDSVGDLQERLLEALDVSTRLRAVDPPLLAEQLHPDLKLGAQIGRRQLAEEVLRFLSAQRTATAPGEDPLKLLLRQRKAVQQLLQLAASAQKPGQAFVEVLRGELQKRLEAAWSEDLSFPALAAHLQSKELLLGPIQWLPGAPTTLLGTMVERLLPPGARKKGPLQPGEGIDLLVGAEEDRVRHLEAQDGAANPLDQIAEVGLLVRRYAWGTDASARPWRMVTGGLPMLPLDDGTAPIAAPQPRGMVAAFENGILQSDFVYRGAALLTASPLEDVHRQSEHELAVGDEGGRLADLTYAAPGLHNDAVIGFGDVAIRYAAPPLRYGDGYQFAAFVVDRGGGLPRELADQEPWRYRPELLDSIALPALSDLRFQRRVAVGDINLKAASERGWPALPTDVVLRGREHFSTLGLPVEQLPTVLLRDGPGIRADMRLPGVDAWLELPQLDEHTLFRWAVPALGDADANAKLNALVSTLTHVYEQRDRCLASGDTDIQLPHDPAVRAIGIRLRLVDGLNKIATQESVLTPNPELAADGSPVPFRFQPMKIEFRIDDLAPGIDGQKIAVASGGFALVEVFPLVKIEEYERFDSDALMDLVEDGEFQGAWIAFKPSRMLIEVATDRLPKPNEVYEALRFAVNAAGAVELRLATDVIGEALPFVDRFRIDAQRWKWRNLPNLPPQSELAALPEPERERRLAGGLPAELASADARIRNSPAVQRFDEIATVDRGLVQRPARAGRVPRTSILVPPPAELYLEEDVRDGVAHADYLRYRLTLRSRYAGVLNTPDVLAASAAAELDDWQRLAVGYVGGALKPPKVLAVLPLTHALRDDPRVAVPAGDTTPFLVILDEVWYREYGQGETLLVGIDRVTREEGDGNDALPIESGPLPDHYLHSAGTLTGQPGQYLLEDRCTVFGPFGYSLDRSGNEALSNASAFVVFLPAKVGPHWSARLRLQRTLEPIVSDIRGASTKRFDGSEVATRRVYTIPDSRWLADVSSEAKGVLQLRKVGSLFETDPISTVRLRLEPHACAGMNSEQRAELLMGYRYLMLLGPMLSDGGRGVDLFLPNAVMLADAQGRWSAIGETPNFEQRLHGRIVEVMLNGRFAPEGTSEKADLSPLDQASDFKKCFRLLFPADEPEPKDAVGMIRRISDTFEVRLAT